MTWSWLVEDNRPWWDAGHCNMRRSNLQSAVHSFGKHFHPASPLLLVLRLSAIRISIRESIVKVLAQIHRETSHRDALPPSSQCLPTPTGQFGPGLAHNGQITTIILWECVCVCSVRGKENCKIPVPSRDVSPALGALHWWEMSHLEQEVISKSQQQRLDCDILRKFREQLMMMVFCELSCLYFRMITFEPVNYAWWYFVFYVAQKG